jgi:branched-chain amino acid transport system permease protein
MHNTNKSFFADWTNWQVVVAMGFVVACGLGGSFVESDYLLQVMVLAAIYAAIGTAWSIAGGLSGLLLLGYISFFGAGAYLDGVLFTRMGVNPWLCIVLAFFSAAALAWLISLVTLRFGLAEDYFAMFTVALSQVFKYILLNWDYAGGATGIYLTVVQDDFWTLSFIDRKPYLYIALVMLAAVILTTYAVQKSRMGYYLAAVRENDQAAEALGINVRKVKTQAMILSGGMAGSIGAFYTQFATFIDPKQVFSLATNFEMLLGPVLGGRLSIIGPVFGASFLKPTQDFLRGWMGGEADAVYLILYGAVLAIGILLLPKGAAHYVQIWHRRRYANQAQTLAVGNTETITTVGASK